MVQPKGAPVAGQTMIVPVAHPVLRDITDDSLLVFQRARNEYLRVMKDHKNAGSTAEPVSLKASIEPSLLAGLVELGEFEGVSDADTLSDAAIEAWLKTQLKPEDDDLVPLKDIASAVRKNVRMDTQVAIAKLRIKKLFLDYRRFMKEHSWDHIVETKVQESTAHLCALLQPPALRTRVKTAIDCEKDGIHANWKKFVAYCLKEAVAIDRYVPVTPIAPTPNPSDAATLPARTAQRAAEEPHPLPQGSRRKNRRGNRSNEPRSFSGTSRTTTSEPRDAPPSRTQPTTPAASLTSSQGSSSAAASSTRSRSPPKCLNTKCDGYHLLKHCPKTSPEERRTLLEHWRESRAAGSLKAMAPTTDANAGVPPPASFGVLKGHLADAVNVLVNLDSGAAHSALSASHLTACDKAQLFVPIQKLAKPIPMKLAVNQTAGAPELTCNVLRKARLTLTLHTHAGPLRLRHINFLVLEEPMDEILLARPVLQEMGYDPNHFVALHRDRFQDAEFSHVGFDTNSPGAARRRPPAVPSPLARIVLDRSGNCRLQHSTAPPIARAMTASGKRSASPSYLAALSSSLPSSVDISARPTVHASVAYPPSSRDPSVPSPLFYGDGCDDDPLRDDDAPLPGDDDAAETQRHLRDRVREAKAQGMEEEHVRELDSLLQEFSDIFRTKLGADPPARVPPMDIKLKPDAKPVRVKLRRYSPPQAAFLRRKTDELLRLGLIRRNPTSQWACAPMMVPKPGPEQFRLTIDLRPVNNQTVPHNWPMPHIETAIAKLAQAKCYANIDLCHGYWQMPLAPNAQECQSFITPEGVFSPTRVLHGQSNAVFFFQSTVGGLCESLRDHILQWLDDLLFYARDTRQLLTVANEDPHLVG